jgi:type I restriction enzyme S subunit
MRVRFDHDYVLPAYAELFFQSATARDRLTAQSKSSAGQQGVSGADIKSQPFALPPFEEQQRLVKAIAVLLSKVGAARDHLSRVPGILKRFRQAVLAAACSGRLTEDWRNVHSNEEENGTALAKRLLGTKSSIKSDRVRQSLLPLIDDDEKPLELPDTWAYARLGNLCSQIADIDHQMPKAVTNGVKFISAKDLLDDGTLNLTREVKLISETDYLRLSRKAKPQRNDIIYSRIGTVGKARLVETDERFLVSYSCCIVRPLIINPKYLMGYLDSGVVLAKARQQARSIGVPDLGLDEINNFVVPLPPLAEQEEIVTRLDALLAFAKRVEQHVTLATRYCDSLTQSILAKAFRGELVPTEAELARREGREYESASLLLERIRAERADQSKTTSVPKRKMSKASAHV